MGPAVAFAKSMNCVERRQEAVRSGGKLICCEVAQEIVSTQPGKKLAKLCRDILRIAENTVALTNSHTSKLASPGIDVLE